MTEMASIPSECNFYHLVQIGPNAYYFYKHLESHPNVGIKNLCEIDILSRFSHPYIIHTEAILTPYTSNHDGVNLLLPVTEKNLCALLSDYSLTTIDKLPYLYQIASALQYLHQNQLLHLDVKALNVGLYYQNDKCFALLTNMMLAMSSNDKPWDQVRVTLDHRAPELLNDGPYYYNFAVDVWSYGIMFLYLLTGRGIYPVDFTSISITELKAVVESTFTAEYLLTLLSGVDEKYRSLCLDLCQRILVIDPNQRCTMTDIVQHPLFAEITQPLTNKIIKSPYVVDYGEFHRDILKLMVNYCMKLYGSEHIQGLFIAIDIYKRCSVYYKSKTLNDNFILGLTSLYMAAKLCNFQPGTISEFLTDIEIEEYTVTETDIISTEIAILHMTNGILSQSLYDMCQTRGCIIYLIDEVLLSRDTKLYSQITPEKLKPYNDGQSRNITINDAYS